MSDSTAPSGAKVIIAGAGIAGPILAVFLKLRGYAPVVYERLPVLGDAGLSLWYAPPPLSFFPRRDSSTIVCNSLQPNGLRILSQIPDFVPSAQEHTLG
ncbi:hypothetical protein EVG20_g3040 [Dentipellis fragilis]|uniref:FAD-binding domain-containing protein n=1 Tax=Dentipellis fragilis TaxID=205917 RepID=A0A4Y9Z8K6_9AGAM|nr:hypothetical protein EVG20_g3040 [Dentipellis fragilis]